MWRGFRELYWYSHVPSQREQARLQAELENYTNLVVHEEFPLLGHHQTSQKAQAAAFAIRLRHSCL